MNPFLQNIRQFLLRLTLQQRLTLAGVFVGGIVVLSAVAYWAGQPDYALLFGKLGPEDANKVVEALKTDGVRYELRENGTAVYVPREEVYELRLRFAGEGLISDGPVGYELFDGSTLGMTDFMQKLNLKRALEGELAKTISNIRQVDICRVHLVMPERSPFRETQNTPSASVVLQLAGGTRLSPDQIEGITALVAGAVEGLSPSDVTVLDTRGNMLSDPRSGDPEAMISSNQLRMQGAVEKHLTDKGQSMLDQILGPGNALVRVTATLDFSRAVSERELIDPESATIVAEQRMEVEGEVDSQNESVRNYELSRTVERSEKSVGAISYLTVSVILNHKPMAVEAAGGGEAGEAPGPAPYPDGELQEIEAIVKNAVGFQPDRGDRFAIHQTRFDTSVDDQIATELREQRQTEQLQLYLRYGLMILALGLGVWLLRSASQRVTEAVEKGDPLFLGAGRSGRSSALEGRGNNFDALAGGDGYIASQLTAGEEVVMVDDVFTSKLSAEAKARLKAKHKMFEEIKKHVTERPQDAAELIRTWLMEDLKLDI